MKRNNCLYFLLFGLVFILTSCERTEADLFEKSAALRLNSAIADTKTHLLSANNGWVMEYFPTNDFAGVTFLINFNENKMAKVATQNTYTPNYVESEGAWDVIGDTGPVITFNTYIDIFHLFSDPNSGYGQGLGVGLGGDYEFIVMNITDDFIQLKGKKRGTDIRLYRLAENQDWKDYFTLLGKKDATLFNVNVPKLQLAVKDSVFTLTGGTSHIFKIVPENDPIADGVDMPFIVTNYGIRFAKAFEVGDQSIQTFQLSEDKNSLICTDPDVDAKIEGPRPVDFFFDITMELSKIMAMATGEDDMSLSVKAIYDKITQSVDKKNRKLSMISFSKSKTWGTSLIVKLLTSSNEEQEAFFNYSFIKESGNEITFSFNGFNMPKDSDYPNDNLFFSQFAGIEDLINLINGKFTASIIGNTLVPTTIKLTSVLNPDIWFILTLK